LSFQHLNFSTKFFFLKAGWGDHAYDQVVPEVHSPQADPQYGQLPPQQVPVHPPGQNQQQFNQESQNIPAQHQQPPQKIDPVYGI